MRLEINGSLIHPVTIPLHELQIKVALSFYELLVSKMKPFSLVDLPYFKRLIKTLHESIELLSRRTVQKRIIAVEMDHKLIVCGALQKPKKKVSVTKDSYC